MKVNANEDFRRRFTLTFDDDDDGSDVPGTGVAFTARWAASKTGASLGVEVIVREYPSTPGRYRIEADQVEMQKLLPDYRNKGAYLILSVDGDVDFLWRRYTITDNRAA